MLRTYRIPIWSNSGFTSSSKTIDYQAGYEKATGTLLSALAGGHLHLFQGGSCSELLYSPELSVMDDDVAGWIGRVLEGATINDETLAVDVINQVGPVPGHYLGTAHTRQRWRKENFSPKVVDREDYASWIQTGKRDMLARAKSRVQEIIASHKPLPLTDEQEVALQEILAEAREFYRAKGMISEDEWAEYMRVIEDGK